MVKYFNFLGKMIREYYRKQTTLVDLKLLKLYRIAFGADQFDTTTAKGKKQLQRFFDRLYF